jgi:phosphate transport system substrate-binding protein
MFPIYLSTAERIVMVANSMKLSFLAGAIALGTASVGLSVYTATAQSVIKVDGSSTVYPITEKIAEGFQKNNSAKVTVGISGTGGGFKKFCAKGGTDISNASRKIKAAEAEACAAAGVKYMELPVAIDALAVVVNKTNSWVDGLTIAELKKMWEPKAEGTIKTWNQVRPSFPNTAIKLFGAGADSGTFDYFTERVNGKERASRKDYTPSEDDNVLVQGVSRDRASLGYFGFAYYAANENKLRAVKINGIAPSSETVLVKDPKKRYPLSRDIYIYVNMDSAKRPEVKAFVEYYLQNGKQAALDVKYVPQPDSVYSNELTKFQAAAK